MYMMMSLSGSSDSSINSCAINKFATVSSTGVPKKMMRSFARREYGSHAVRPRGVSWIIRGIGTYSLRIFGLRPVGGSGGVLAFGCVQRQIDLVDLLVDHSCMFDEEFECFSSCDI